MVSPVDEIEGGIPCGELEGYYVDTGCSLNGRTRFAKVAEGVAEDNRQVIYVHSEGHYALHTLDSAHKGEHWIKSVEMARDTPISDDLHWLYWNSEQGRSRFESIKLHIRALLRAPISR